MNHSAALALPCAANCRCERRAAFMQPHLELRVRCFLVARAFLFRVVRMRKANDGELRPGGANSRAAGCRVQSVIVCSLSDGAQIRQLAATVRISSERRRVFSARSRPLQPRRLFSALSARAAYLQSPTRGENAREDGWRRRSLPLLWLWLSGGKRAPLKTWNMRVQTVATSCKTRARVETRRVS